MKKIAIITVILLNTFLMSCSVQEEEATIPDEYKSKNITVSYTQLDYEVAELINAYRISQGYNSLNMLNEASKAAITHSQYMINQGTPSHDYFFLRSQKLKETVNAINVSENVAYGYSTAQSVVNAWLNSESHKENIENREFTDFGISTNKDENGKYYFTNIFVKR